MARTVPHRGHIVLPINSMTGYTEYILQLRTNQGDAFSDPETCASWSIMLLIRPPLPGRSERKKPDNEQPTRPVLTSFGKDKGSRVNPGSKYRVRLTLAAVLVQNVLLTVPVFWIIPVIIDGYMVKVLAGSA